MLIPTRRAEDLFAGWWQLIARWVRCRGRLVWDGEGAVGRWRGGRAELTEECQAFRGMLGTKVIVCKPADPEAKGLIERSMTTWSARSCPAAPSPSPADFNTQFSDWLALVNTRTAPGAGVRPDRPDRRRPGGDAGACRRWRRRPGGARRCGCPGTTTSGWTPTTTRCTRP